MKKLFSIVSGIVMAAAVVPAHAAIQYTQQNFSGGSWFSVDKKQTIYLNVKNAEGENVSIKDAGISNIGWYKYDEIYNNFYHKSAAPTLNYGDMKNGALGEFSPEDRIVLWIETTDSKGKVETYSMYNPRSWHNDIWAKGDNGENVVLNWGDFVNIVGSQTAVNPEGFEFSISTTPNGQPLPGIIATLLVSGGCGSLLYLKKRKKLKAAK